MSGSKRSDHSTDHSTDHSAGHSADQARDTSPKRAAQRARGALSQIQRDELSSLRRVFFKRAREEATRWGGESVDLAWTYYPRLEEDQGGEQTSADRGDLNADDIDHVESAPRLVTDRIHLPRVGVTTLELIDSIAADWWPSRREVTEGGAQHRAICGFYGRFICASGFSLVVEFNAAHIADPELPPTLWRVDGRAEGVELTYPQDEGECYEQLGAYLDLRVGWSWVTRESLKHKALITAEVEPGYLIGVRPGDPLSDEDPAEREDPDIEAVFSRFDIERFDTLEFLNVGLDALPDFKPERFDSWLPEELAEPLLSGQVEAFVLSRLDRFVDAIEDVAERRQIEVERSDMGDDDETPQLKLTRGPLSMTRELAHPYLWTLHSGLQHYEGALRSFRDDLDRLYQASELYFNIRSTLAPELKRGELSLEVNHERELVIWSHREVDVASQELMRAPLIDWSDGHVFTEREGAQRFLKLWGWREEERAWHTPKHALDSCPLSDRPASVIRVIRPHDQADAERALGTRFEGGLPERLWGYYALRSERHITPIFWERAAVIERSLNDQTHRVIDIKSSRSIDVMGVEVELLWGEELAGSLLHVEVREALRERGGLYAYAFTPDLIALSYLDFEPALLDALRPHVELTLAQLNPESMSLEVLNLEWRVPLK